MGWTYGGTLRQVMIKSKRLQTLSALAVLVAIACLAFSAGTGAAVPSGAEELEFATDTAEAAAGQVAVPVECIGEPTGLCSGTLAVSWHGRRAVSTFSVLGGNRDTVLVPLAAGPRAKLSAVATTSQSLGPAVVRKAILHVG
jgi:hypothetical protein